MEPRRPGASFVVAALVGGLALSACGSSTTPNQNSDAGSSPTGRDASTGSATDGGSTGSATDGGSTGRTTPDASSGSPGTDGAAGGSETSVLDSGASASMTGNPNGHCTIPAAAQAVDVSHPTTVVGTGTAASCTGDAVVAAVHAGGIVTFNCGPEPVTIPVPEILIYNDGGPTKDGSVTLDGGGKITLSGGGKNRILHQDTCDSSLHYTSPYCNNQDTPHLVVQNIAFSGGSGAADESALLGGGAIYAGGGTFKAVNVLVVGSTQTNAADV